MRVRGQPGANARSVAAARIAAAAVAALGSIAGGCVDRIGRESFSCANGGPCPPAADAAIGRDGGAWDALADAGFVSFDASAFDAAEAGDGGIRDGEAVGDSAAADAELDGGVDAGLDGGLDVAPDGGAGALDGEVGAELDSGAEASDGGDATDSGGTSPSDASEGGDASGGVGDASDGGVRDGSGAADASDGGVRDASGGGDASGGASDANDIGASDASDGASDANDGGCTRILRVSVNARGDEANQHSSAPDISPDGRYVAFASRADNLVPGDSNATSDVFLVDRVTGTIERVSVSSGGVQGDGPSHEPSVAAGGRYVAFTSNARNLAPPGGAGNVSEIYLRDRLSGTTVLVSAPLNLASSNGASSRPRLSRNGEVLVFESLATNLPPGNGSGDSDVFHWVRATGAMTIVSVGQGGAAADDASFRPDVSFDGNTVAFQSAASNLVAADTNGSADIFVRDMTLQTTVRASVSTEGTQGTYASAYASLAPSGQSVFFVTPNAWNIVVPAFSLQIYRRRLGPPLTNAVTIGQSGAGAMGICWFSSPSYFGDVVAFVSSAPDLVPGDTNGAADIFISNPPNAISRIMASDGSQPHSGSSDEPAIDESGRVVVFSSDARNLVPDDTNGFEDVFIAAALPDVCL